MPTFKLISNNSNFIKQKILINHNDISFKYAQTKKVNILTFFLYLFIFIN
jgi:hypothetical protein